MNPEEQRKVGLRLAKAAGATNTQAAIMNDDFCYEDILKTAADEVGVDSLVSNVLQGDPLWAYHTLRHVPGLGAGRDRLLEKAAETPEVAAYTVRYVPDLGSQREAITEAAKPYAISIGNISAMYLLDQGGFNCAFTMLWTNNGQSEPKKGADKKWSPTLLLGQSAKEKCSFFALPDSPLEPGNEVWMYAWVQAGTDNDSLLRFTYDPNVTTTAEFTISGTTTINRLGFNGFS
jgi:hypothetical protein